MPRVLLQLAAIGLVAGCGSSGNSDVFEDSGGAAPVGGNAASGNGGGGHAGSASTGGASTGGASTGGVSTGGVSTGGGGGTCADGVSELCPCPSGTFGSRLCGPAGWGACEGCEGATPCIAGEQRSCPCTSGLAGTQSCEAGFFGACAGCDTGPVTGCPAPFVCTPSGFGPFCADPALGGAPPPCQFPSGSCTHVGGSCAVTPLGAYCLAACTP